MWTRPEQQHATRSGSRRAVSALCPIPRVHLLLYRAGCFLWLSQGSPLSLPRSFPLALLPPCPALASPPKSSSSRWASDELSQSIKCTHPTKTPQQQSSHKTTLENGVSPKYILSRVGRKNNRAKKIFQLGSVPAMPLLSPLCANSLPSLILFPAT